ncbi:hypothetical protein PoB_000562000 [Plakobranchus ocellatus]|uniref:Uncharacterized protein n=1 Tax=Plakobranchus ocellatus TaxID=259542 RepID=A0AAV3Y7L0_9GAST|nr:hypothetical protein PoB_000562000 [Plakobranchus ocellatus]
MATITNESRLPKVAAPSGVAAEIECGPEEICKHQVQSRTAEAWSGSLPSVRPCEDNAELARQTSGHESFSEH